MTSHTGTATALVQQSDSSGGQGLSGPVRKTAQNAPHDKITAPAQASPGRFRHPRLTEIAKRRAASSFSSRNIQNIILNAAVILGTFVISDWIRPALDTVVKSTRADTVALNTSTILHLIRLIFVCNIYFSLRPILPYVSGPDAIEDIALTPSQRALLGLPPSQSNTPSSAKDDGHYITPPRYRRSSPSPFAGTPQSEESGRSMSANYSASPLSTSRYTVGFSPTPQQASVTPGRRASGTGPFSPSSPLFSKALVNSVSLSNLVQQPDFTESTRSLVEGSTGTNTNTNTNTSSLQNNLRRSQGVRERRGPGQDPGTPSPSSREKVKLQPGVNYKWLYEKGMKLGRNGIIERD